MTDTRPAEALDAAEQRDPPEATFVAAGDFVKWASSGGTSKGQVKSVHTSSTVPGVPVKVVGTEEEPAAKIEMWRPAGDGWEASGMHVAHKVSALTKIEPLAGPAAKPGAPTIPIGVIGHGGTITLAAPAPAQRSGEPTIEAHTSELADWLGGIPRGAR